MPSRVDSAIPIPEKYCTSKIRKKGFYVYQFQSSLNLDLTSKESYRLAKRTTLLILYEVRSSK